MFDRTFELINDGGTATVQTSGLAGGGQLPFAAFVLLLAAVCLAAYFLGNISPSTILARARGIDIKKEGSGNAGTTNALRVMGKKAAVITLVIDILKGVAAVILGWLLVGYPGAMGCVLFVVLGHVWPIIYKFQGGKGIATSFGALLALDPVLALIELGIVAAATLISKRMSVGSITGLVLLPAAALIRAPEFLGISIVLAVIMLVKHRNNIVRLIHGEEPKLGFLDKDKKEKDI